MMDINACSEKVQNFDILRSFILCESLGMFMCRATPEKRRSLENVNRFLMKLFQYFFSEVLIAAQSWMTCILLGFITNA